MMPGANEYSSLLSASQKRSLIRRKKNTFNLMSLDEYVLNFYDRFRNTAGGGGGGNSGGNDGSGDNHPSPSNSTTGGHHRHPNLTIHECTNESTDSGGATQQLQHQQSTAASPPPQSKITTTSTTSKPKLSNFGNLVTPHANFISLRSGGTDSLNSGWGGVIGGGGGGGCGMGGATPAAMGHHPNHGGFIKPTRSYDYGDDSLNQLEGADIYTSSSLQHSQFLLPPPSLGSIAPVSGKSYFLFVYYIFHYETSRRDFFFSTFNFIFHLFLSGFVVVIITIFICRRRLITFQSIDR